MFRIVARATIRRWVGALFALLMAAPAGAQAHDGNKFLALCSTAEASTVAYYADAASCLNYVVGVVDAVNSMLVPPAPRIWCAPSGVTSGQARDVAIRYVIAHPEKRHTLAASMIIVALHEAFPCPR